MKQLFIQKQIEYFMAEASLIHDKYVKDNQVPTDTATIYHYTDYVGLSGILQNNNMWFTDARYLNDPLEITYSFNIINTVLDNHIHQTKYKEFWDEFKRLYQCNILDPKKLATYTCSYCTRHDCLPAWRFYANNGTGFALGMRIRVENNDDTLAQDNTVITKINYKKEEAEAMILQFFTLGDETFGKVNSELKYQTDTKNFIKQLKAAITSQLIPLLPTFKHHEYSAEEEIRQYKHHINPTTHFALKDGFFERERKNTESLPFVKKRTDKIPTLKYPFEKEQLSEIWIGPCCEFLEAKNGIIKLLTDNGYDTKKVKIYPSKLPYRY